ncbi:putative chloroplast RF65 [Micractinium conductrix]|uniref:30S ribosomal protein 3, chloroplastic n=1 Tax=Micractinium conductrix TaxID=554055 RepID=A0A2P6V7Z7_9CHLO|nr:putative chloroplast RF65 [Micractinium conductrix]|eukprot:PSC70211.1 putative chloroplast RF65 [Micractinium conductrix]
MASCFVVARAAARPAQVARSSKVRQLAARAPYRAMYFHTRQSIMAAAAEAEEAVVEEEEEVVEEVEEEDVPSSSFAAKLAKLQAAEGAPAPDAQFALNFLWLDKNIAVAVDQVFGQGQRSPVTEYFFWPRKDAWEELKATLDTRGWIGEREKVLLLNTTTEVINYWQDENKHSLEEARAAFPGCKFQGS